MVCVEVRSAIQLSTIVSSLFRSSIGGSVVECSPATRAARVRFPADATFPRGSCKPVLFRHEKPAPFLISGIIMSVTVCTPKGEKKQVPTPGIEPGPPA